MTNNLIRVLLVEDDLGDADLICELLELVRSADFQVTHCQHLQQALQHLSGELFDVVLLDLSLPDSHGVTTVSQVYARSPTVPIVILSGLEDESLAVQALHQGAQDYLVKGKVESDLLVRAIRYAIERTKIRLLLNQKEEQLREALAQEKELSELKSRIITTVSHEYRTPLTTISSSAQMLQTYRHKWDDEKQLKHFQRIQTAIRHMVTLVNDVLFLNKAEFEKVEFQPTPVDLIPFFQEVVDELQSTVDERYCLMFIHQGNCTQRLVDEKLLRQILSNLLSNAIKYSPDGGKVQVRLSCEDNDKVTFQVQDEGIGIPPEDRDNLFQPFSRANNVGTIAGTGLGLSIVKKCVDLHGGQIVVESEVGAGTTFNVSLPVGGGSFVF